MGESLPPFRCAVRIRPLLGKQQQNCISITEDANTSINSTAGTGAGGGSGATGTNIIVTDPATGDGREFLNLPVVIGPEVDQKDCFDILDVQSFVRAVLNGYHTTIIAYGQTGSGKTHTVIGGDQLDGIIPRAITELYKAKDQLLADTPGMLCRIRASFLEIGNAPGVVNEVITDLLDTSKTNLQVRYNENLVPFVSELTCVECTTPEDAIVVLQEGAKYRRTSSTRMNERSSRSHSIFTLYVETADQFAKFQFVDLAGSERVKASQAAGFQLKETQTINKSLFTLGQVILAVVNAQSDSNGTRADHIPYRNSKVTELLSDSFGGNSFCMMITCITPNHYEETSQSLSYATRAMRIENRPMKNKLQSPSKGNTADAESLAELRINSKEREIDRHILEKEELQEENRRLLENLEEMKRQGEDMLSSSMMMNPIMNPMMNTMINPLMMQQQMLLQQQLLMNQQQLMATHSENMGNPMNVSNMGSLPMMGMMPMSHLGSQSNLPMMGPISDMPMFSNASWNPYQMILGVMPPNFSPPAGGNDMEIVDVNSRGGSGKNSVMTGGFGHQRGDSKDNGGNKVAEGYQGDQNGQQQRGMQQQNNTARHYNAQKSQRQQENSGSVPQQSMDELSPIAPLDSATLLDKTPMLDHTPTREGEHRNEINEIRVVPPIDGSGRVNYQNPAAHSANSEYDTSENEELNRLEKEEERLESELKDFSNKKSEESYVSIFLKKKQEQDRLEQQRKRQEEKLQKKRRKLSAAGSAVASARPSHRDHHHGGGSQPAMSHRDPVHKEGSHKSHGPPKLPAIPDPYATGGKFRSPVNNGANVAINSVAQSVAQNILDSRMSSKSNAVQQDAGDYGPQMKLDRDPPHLSVEPKHSIQGNRHDLSEHLDEMLSGRNVSSASKARKKLYEDVSGSRQIEVRDSVIEDFNKHQNKILKSQEEKKLMQQEQHQAANAMKNALLGQQNGQDQQANGKQASGQPNGSQVPVHASKSTPVTKETKPPNSSSSSAVPNGAMPMGKSATTGGIRKAPQPLGPNLGIPSSGSGSNAASPLSPNAAPNASPFLMPRNLNVPIGHSQSGVSHTQSSGSAASGMMPNILMPGTGSTAGASRSVSKELKLPLKAFQQLDGGDTQDAKFFENLMSQIKEGGGLKDPNLQHLSPQYLQLAATQLEQMKSLGLVPSHTKFSSPNGQHVEPLKVPSINPNMLLSPTAAGAVPMIGGTPTTTGMIPGAMPMTHVGTEQSSMGHVPTGQSIQSAMSHQMSAGARSENRISNPIQSQSSTENFSNSGTPTAKKIMGFRERPSVVQEEDYYDTHPSTMQKTGAAIVGSGTTSGASGTQTGGQPSASAVTSSEEKMKSDAEPLFTTKTVDPMSITNPGFVYEEEFIHQSASSSSSQIGNIPENRFKNLTEKMHKEKMKNDIAIRDRTIASATASASVQGASVQGPRNTNLCSMYSARTGVVSSDDEWQEGVTVGARVEGMRKQDPQCDASPRPKDSFTYPQNMYPRPLNTDAPYNIMCFRKEEPSIQRTIASQILESQALKKMRIDQEVQRKRDKERMMPVEKMIPSMEIKRLYREDGELFTDPATEARHHIYPNTAYESFGGKYVKSDERKYRDRLEVGLARPGSVEGKKGKGKAKDYYYKGQRYSHYGDRQIYENPNREGEPEATIKDVTKDIDRRKRDIEQLLRFGPDGIPPRNPSPTGENKDVRDLYNETWSPGDAHFFDPNVRKDRMYHSFSGLEIDHARYDKYEDSPLTGDPQKWYATNIHNWEYEDPRYRQLNFPNVLEKGGQDLKFVQDRISRVDKLPKGQSPKEALKQTQEQAYYKDSRRGSSPGVLTTTEGMTEEVYVDQFLTRMYGRAMKRKGEEEKKEKGSGQTAGDAPSSDVIEAMKEKHLKMMNRLSLNATGQALAPGSTSIMSQGLVAFPGNTTDESLVNIDAAWGSIPLAAPAESAKKKETPFQSIYFGAVNTPQNNLNETTQRGKGSSSSKGKSQSPRRNSDVASTMDGRGDNILKQMVQRHSKLDISHGKTTGSTSFPLSKQRKSMSKGLTSDVWSGKNLEWPPKGLKKPAYWDSPDKSPDNSKGYHGSPRGSISKDSVKGYSPRGFMSEESPKSTWGSITKGSPNKGKSFAKGSRGKDGKDGKDEKGRRYSVDSTYSAGKGSSQSVAKGKDGTLYSRDGYYSKDGGKSWSLKGTGSEKGSDKGSPLGKDKSGSKKFPPDKGGKNKSSPRGSFSKSSKDVGEGSPFKSGKGSPDKGTDSPDYKGGKRSPSKDSYKSSGKTPFDSPKGKSTKGSPDKGKGRSSPKRRGSLQSNASLEKSPISKDRRASLQSGFESDKRRGSLRHSSTIESFFDDYDMHSDMLSTQGGSRAQTPHDVGKRNSNANTYELAGPKINYDELTPADVLYDEELQHTSQPYRQIKQDLDKLMLEDSPRSKHAILHNIYSKFQEKAVDGFTDADNAFQMHEREIKDIFENLAKDPLLRSVLAQPPSVNDLHNPTTTKKTTGSPQMHAIETSGVSPDEPFNPSASVQFSRQPDRALGVQRSVSTELINIKDGKKGAPRGRGGLQSPSTRNSIGDSPRTRPSIGGSPRARASVGSIGTSPRRTSLRGYQKVSRPSNGSKERPETKAIPTSNVSKSPSSNVRHPKPPPGEPSAPSFGGSNRKNVNRSSKGSVGSYREGSHRKEDYMSDGAQKNENLYKKYLRKDGSEIMLMSPSGPDRKPGPDEFAKTPYYRPIQLKNEFIEQYENQSFQRPPDPYGNRNGTGSPYGGGHSGGYVSNSGGPQIGPPQGDTCTVSPVNRGYNESVASFLERDSPRKLRAQIGNINGLSNNQLHEMHDHVGDLEAKIASMQAMVSGMNS